MLQYWKDGKDESFVASAVREATLPQAAVQAKTKLGIAVEQVTPALAEKYGLSVDYGLLVRSVARDSVAERTGIQPGDVIVSLGNFRIKTMAEFSNLVGRLPDNGRVHIGIIRQDEPGSGWLLFGQ